MILQQQNSLTPDAAHWYSSDLLLTPHAMLCRSGGTSAPPFASLNLSFGVGDNPNAVKANRQLLKQCLELDYLVSTTQIHGDKVVIAEDIRKDTELGRCDGLISDQPNIGLLIQQADCQAVLLHDQTQKVIGAIHSGWRGSTLNIIGKTVAVMQNHFGVNPVDLRAVISPSLGPCCAQFTNFQLELPESFRAWQVKPCYFDFWAISRNQLVEAGLKNGHIETTGICTMCSKDFFSYRRATRHGDGTTGRNASIIALQK